MILLVIHPTITEFIVITPLFSLLKPNTYMQYSEQNVYNFIFRALYPYLKLKGIMKCQTCILMILLHPNLGAHCNYGESGEIREGRVEMKQGLKELRSEQGKQGDRD